MLLSLKKLRRTYGGKGGVVDVSLSLETGAVYALCGVNGAGKTTTLSVLSGLIFAEAGSLSIEGADLPLNRHVPRPGLGYAPDTPVLDEQLTPWQWLHFIGGLKGAGIPESAAELASTLSIPAEMLAAPIRTLSFGNKRKASLWVEILTTSKVLLLDEPFTGLDPLAIEGLHTAIHAFVRGGRSVILSTHLLREAESLATHVGFIHDGRSLVEGPLAEICAGEPLQETFLAAVHEAGYTADHASDGSYAPDEAVDPVSGEAVDRAGVSA